MPDVAIGPATIRDVSYLLGNLRPADREELFCQFPDDAPLDAVAATCVRPAEAFVAYLRGAPVMAFGFTPQTLAGNVISAWAFGTAKATRVIPAITRFVRDELAPFWIEAGVTRMEARSILGHSTAHRWMEATGAVRECDLPLWGKGGETFVLFAWRASDFGA